MKKIFFSVLFFFLFIGCETNDSGNQIVFEIMPPEISYDYDIIAFTDADIEDVDAGDATEITEDPHQEFMTCDGAIAGFYYPWAYYMHYVIETRSDGYNYAYDARFRYNFETGIQEELPPSDKIGWGNFAYVNPHNQKIYSSGRTVRYINNPGDDGEYGPWTIRVTEVDTGNFYDIYSGQQLLSEDCYNQDITPGNGNSILTIWKMTDDESIGLLTCQTSNGGDLYRYNFTTGEITYLLRATEESERYGACNLRGYYLQDIGEDYVGYIFGGGNWSTPEIRVWNWKTGELMWYHIDQNIAGIVPLPTENGWIYYTEMYEKEGSYYLKAKGYNFLTGEERQVPQVMENTFAVFPMYAGRPELLFFEAGDGPIGSAEPRIPFGDKYYYLWNQETGVVRKLTLLPVSYGMGAILKGTPQPRIALYYNGIGQYPCYYYKDLQAAGIMDTQGNLIPNP